VRKLGQQRAVGEHRVGDQRAVSRASKVIYADIDLLLWLMSARRERRFVRCRPVQRLVIASPNRVRRRCWRSGLRSVSPAIRRAGERAARWCRAGCASQGDAGAHSKNGQSCAHGTGMVPRPSAVQRS
jgi:hypothetical protein